ncbi:MAG: hypothetical protein ABIR71_01745 [Chthoniobacterales bacterium]
MPVTINSPATLHYPGRQRSHANRSPFRHPTLTTAGATNSGTIYGGAALDGSASFFLLGSTSAVDVNYDFDGRFGINDETAFQPAGVVVYKFNNLRITGGPV